MQQKAVLVWILMTKDSVWTGKMNFCLLYYLVIIRWQKIIWHDGSFSHSAFDCFFFCRWWDPVRSKVSSGWDKVQQQKNSHDPVFALLSAWAKKRESTKQKKVGVQIFTALFGHVYHLCTRLLYIAICTLKFTTFSCLTTFIKQLKTMRKKGCYIYTMMPYTSCIPVKNSHFS